MDEFNNRYSLGDATETNIDQTSWSPERKVVGGAIAVVAVTAVQLAFGLDLPPALEGAVAILAAYWVKGNR